MKRFLTILCVICVICALSACNKNGLTESTTPTSTESSVQIPKGSQQDVSASIRQYVEMTGDSTSYTVNATYQINSTKTHYVFQGNGAGLFYQDTLTTKQIEIGKVETKSLTVYLDTAEHRIYTKRSDQYVADNGFRSAVSLKEALNQIIGDNFFGATVNALSNLNLSIGKYNYELPVYYIQTASETIFFDKASIVLDSNYRLIEFHCVSGPQSIDITISGFNNTEITLPENISENSSETP